MPYKSLADTNPSLRGIRPRITLEQANEIANIADTIAKTNPAGAWPIAIASFKKSHVVRGGRWVKRQKKTSEVAEEIHREFGEGLHGHKPIVPDIEPLEEAATYKAKCQALIRDMASIMADRTLPDAMRSALSHIQSELKRTWADLEADGMPTMEASMSELLAEVVKTVGGKTFPASDFLVVENPDEPSTWHLQVSDHGKPDHRLMGAAMAALTNGYRGNKYEGPMKGKAMAKLRAMYKSEDMTMPAESAAEADPKENGYDMPMTTMSMPVMGATTFADLDAAENAQDAAQEVNKRVYQFQDLVRNALGDMTITDKVSAIKKIADEFVSLIGELMADPTAPTTEGAITESEQFAESESGTALTLIEEAIQNDGVRAPVTVDFVMIKPGAGNKKDNHWYPADVLKRDAHVFENADIFATDHKDNERSERTKVGKVKSITGFNEQGAPIARTIIFDPDMAEKTRNRAQANELGTLECSILGQGVSKPKDIDGSRYNVVESITKGIALELVSKAGAGGHALNIAESSEGGEQVDESKTTPPVSGTPPAPTQPVAEAQPTTPTMLVESEVKRIVGETNLPDAAKEWLGESQYKTEAELKEAITKAIERVKKLTGAGKPTNLGGTAPVSERISETDYQKRLEDIDRKYGLRG